MINSQSIEVGRDPPNHPTFERFSLSSHVPQLPLTPRQIQAKTSSPENFERQTHCCNITQIRLCKQLRKQATLGECYEQIALQTALKLLQLQRPNMSLYYDEQMLM